MADGRRGSCCAWRGILAVLAMAAAASAAAQSSSMFGDPQTRRGLSVTDSSWTYEMPPDSKQIKLHDQLTLIVKETTKVESKGMMDRRKDANLDAKLSHWTLLDKFALVPDPQTQGSPEVTGSLSNKLRSQADLETSDSMTFKIAVTVVDKRPNGYLVIEGHRSIYNNHESWEQCVTGVIRPEDILPANTVLSENVAELRIFKREGGHVRDGYRRGWLFQWLDKYQPF